MLQFGHNLESILQRYPTDEPLKKRLPSMRSLSTVNSIYCRCNIIHHAVESVRHKNKVEIYKTGFESVKNVNFVAVFINPINFSALEFT